MWITLVIWLITYLLSSSKKGTSSGKAALIATGVAGAAYLYQTANGVGDGATTTTGAAVTEDSGSVQTPISGPALSQTIGSTLTSLGNDASKILSTPGGQVALVGGTLSSVGGSDTQKWLLWAGIGLAAFIILK